MNGGLMELEETMYRLEIAEGAGLIRPEELEAIKRETEELIAIYVSLINKWRRK